MYFVRVVPLTDCVSVGSILALMGNLSLLYRQ